jgi:aminoglycoside phosphotransferase (APT) family kinase protein
MANTTKCCNANDNTPAPKGKRDREHGMFEDPLVEERTEELGDELPRKLAVLKAENRFLEIYDLIIKYRPGTPVRPLPNIRGGYNAIFPVEYTDGAAMLRVVLPGCVAFPDEKVRNEVATMRYIEKMTSIPVPHIYHWGTATENPLGLGAFIIMDYIPHAHNLCDILEDPTVENPHRQYLSPNIPKDRLERMYKQVASIILQLSKLEMPKIGSIQEHGDSFIVGSRPLTQDMNELIVQAGVPPSILPPQETTYSTSDDWYRALADLHVGHLTFQHNKAIESADDCRDKFVARHLFRQQVRQGKLPAQTTTTNPTAAARGTPDNNKNPPKKRQQNNETFRLWIDDFRPHNILIDADLNIVGVIDWEWAYFAPASFAHDPPWWLLLGRPEYWRGSVLDFRDEFAGALDVFLEALRTEEEVSLMRDEGEEEEEGGEEAWSMDRHIEALSLEEADSDVVRLSDRMRRSWDSGAFWANYAARRCYGFEPVFWEFLDERLFGENIEGGYEGRMQLLSGNVKRRMELFVERKVEDSKEQKIVDWEPEEARSFLAEILAHLD